VYGNPQDACKPMSYLDGPGDPNRHPQDASKSMVYMGGRDGGQTSDINKSYMEGRPQDYGQRPPDGQPMNNLMVLGNPEQQVSVESESLVLKKDRAAKNL